MLASNLVSASCRSLWKSARCYATHASSVETSAGTKLLATSDESKPTASISVFLRAGSRYEPEPGLAHILKNMVFKSTKLSSALGVVREAELLGGILTSSLTREHLILSAEFVKGQEAHFARVLGEVLSHSSFPRHEFTEDVLPAVAAEYNQATHNPVVTAIDVAHQLAFRSGLGNSLLANPDLLSPDSHASAVTYARSCFAMADKHVVVGRGIDADSLSSLVTNYFSADRHPSPPVKCPGSVYYGGDARISSHSSDVLLVAFKGGNKSTQPEFTVLQHLLGSDLTSVKWSAGNSPLSSLPAKAFHLPYSDIGLFGLIIKAPSSEVKSAGSRALAELKSVAQGQGTEQDTVTRAIKKAQLHLASGLESNIVGSEILGAQASGSSSSPMQLQDLYAAYAKVTPDKVIQAAKSVLSSRPSTVSIGNTHKMPYPEELGL